jgi:hypothetical protein
MSSNLEATKFSTDIEVPCDPIFLPDHESRVAKLAYLKAESRGFEAGHELEDWLAAESELLQ